MVAVTSAGDKPAMEVSQSIVRQQRSVFKGSNVRATRVSQFKELSPLESRGRTGKSNKVLTTQRVERLELHEQAGYGTWWRTLELRVVLERGTSEKFEGREVETRREQCS